MSVGEGGGAKKCQQNGGLAFVMFREGEIGAAGKEASRNCGRCNATKGREGGRVPSDTTPSSPTRTRPLACVLCSLNTFCIFSSSFLLNFTTWLIAEMASLLLPLPETAPMVLRGRLLKRCPRWSDSMESERRRFGLRRNLTVGEAWTAACR